MRWGGRGQIIQVNLTQDNLQPLISGKKIDLTYAVQWVETNISFIRRFDAYLDYPFFEHQVGVRRERRAELQDLCSECGWRRELEATCELVVCWRFMGW